MRLQPERVFAKMIGLMKLAPATHERPGTVADHEWSVIRVPKTRPPVERFLAKFEIAESGCWIWTAGRNSDGYGTFNDGVRRGVGAHRFAYLHYVGPIPEGLELDHLCRVRSCVNPDHLEAVTHAENIRRGESPSALCALRRHCVNGHEFSPENTYTSKRGGRECRICKRDYMRAYKPIWRAKQKALGKRYS